MKPRGVYALLFSALFIAGFAASGLAHTWEKPVEADTRRSMIALGTLVEIQVRGLPPEAADRAIRAAFAEIRRYETAVTAVGRVEVGAFQPDGEVAGLMDACNRYWRLSSGTLDCALGTLVEAWGFASGEPRLPEPDVLERAWAASGWEAVQPGPDGDWTFTQPRTLNFGAIAKGAAVDRAVAVLQEYGVHQALVDAGGDVRALGSGWTAGIRHPRQKGLFAGTVRVDGRAAATSGDYEQYFLREEQRYHHLLDPRTGAPAAGSQSVTVLASTAQEADALATAIFVLGSRDGLSLAESLPDVEVFIIDAHGQPAASTGFPLDSANDERNRTMDMTFLAAVGTMGGLGLFFATILAVANRKLHVEESPLMAQVTEALPQANCGACGSAGCQDFAVHLVEGKASVTGCPIGGKALAERLAQILQVAAAEHAPEVAVLLCQGGHANAVLKTADYQGPTGCAPREILSGGEKLCFFGCLGGGDCEAACPVGALRMGQDGLPVIYSDLCTGCGLCVQACPRGVLELHPADHRLFVLCKNQDDARTARQVCEAACLGCGICARASGGAITIENFLAVIDYAQLDPDAIPIERCKPGALKRIKMQ